MAILKDFAARKGITFPLLSDEGSRIIRAYGILNTSVPEDTMFYGIPYPGTFVLSPKGVVVARYFEDDYKQRYTASDILVRQFGADTGAAPSTIETKRLRLSASASTDLVHSGQRIALVLDIDLKPRMHVYAPGVEHYIPINFSIRPSPAIEIHPAVYPPAKTLRLEAIDETVPVYEGKFRIIREVTPAAPDKVTPQLDANGDLTIEGTLRYQACDDKICYIPETVPLKWTVHWEEYDRTRVPAEIQHKAPRK